MIEHFNRRTRRAFASMARRMTREQHRTIAKAVVAWGRAIAARYA